MNYLEIEKEIYTLIARHLITDRGETIEFSTFSPTAYYLPKGCKAFAFPEKTMVVLKPRLVWDSQDRLKMDLEENTAIINKLVVIYCEKADGVNVRLKDGNMKTISYDEFFTHVMKDVPRNLLSSDNEVVPNDVYKFSVCLNTRISMNKGITVYTPPMHGQASELVKEQYFTQERIDELKEQLIEQIKEDPNPFDIYCYDIDGDYRVTERELFYPVVNKEEKE